MTASPVITQFTDLYDVPALADGQTVVSEGGVLVARELLSGEDIGLPTASISGSDVVVTMPASHWGISSAGDPYFNSAGATAGDEAVLVVNPTDGSLEVVKL